MQVSYTHERRLALLIGFVFGTCLGALTWFILVSFIGQTLEMLLRVLPSTLVK